MPRLKSYRRSQAAKKNWAVQKAQPAASSTCYGTGYRHEARTWLTSSLTDHPHQLVIPDRYPGEKFVLLVGDSHLRSVVDGFVEMPRGGLSFGLMATPGGGAQVLKREFEGAVLPSTPDAVCVLAPGINLGKSRTPGAAGADFGSLLTRVLLSCPNVLVVDFPPRLDIAADDQNALRQEFRLVAARMGLQYFYIHNHFPSNCHDLWAKDGIHLSDDAGMPLLLQLIWTATSLHLGSPPPPRGPAPWPDVKAEPEGQSWKLRHPEGERHPEGPQQSVETNRRRRAQPQVMKECFIPLKRVRISTEDLAKVIKRGSITSS
ncbi:hypothetical protein KUCAC02_010809 [Chaenocephalus aceratus]|uniref:Uncharacterized protein n=1 Tax=Chaenocephalus aceratus TaxID=36190 RepID=A0ACB9WUK5_CHAAC|nr:hypothetical protein KUCAC02_010809 [Chaenocephalus aceratus]